MESIYWHYDTVLYTVIPTPSQKSGNNHIPKYGIYCACILPKKPMRTLSTSIWTITGGGLS
ncbi:MAG: hypothetical protein ACI90V_008833 [Bacillariaceae sp.]